MSLYIPKMSDTPGVTIPGLAGNFEQIGLQLESKANKQQEGWITPTLIGGWTFDPDNPVMFRKDEFGMVCFRGRLLPQNATQQEFITLPSGYRTQKAWLFPVATPPNSGFFVAYALNNFVGLASGQLDTSIPYYDLSSIRFVADS